MSNEEVEDFEGWLEKLKAETSPIIVEGESDKAALEKLDIRNVIAIARRPLDSFVENLGVEEVILLLDYDSEGKKLTKELIKILEHNNIKHNLDYWKLLPKFKVTHIEGIYSRFNKLKNRK